MPRETLVEFNGEPDAERWAKAKEIARVLGWAEILISVYNGKIRSIKSVAGELRFKETDEIGKKKTG